LPITKYCRTTTRNETALSSYWDAVRTHIVQLFEHNRRNVADFHLRAGEPLPDHEATMWTRLKSVVFYPTRKRSSLAVTEHDLHAPQPLPSSTILCQTLTYSNKTDIKKPTTNSSQATSLSSSTQHTLDNCFVPTMGPPYDAHRCIYTRSGIIVVIPHK